jgi:hypothetical protein
MPDSAPATKPVTEPPKPKSSWAKGVEAAYLRATRSR